MPAVKAVALVVTITDKSKSPLALVVRLPVLGDALLPCAVIGVASRELFGATPEYSKMEIRNGPATVSDTVMVSAPPLMLSA